MKSLVRISGVVCIGILFLHPGIAAAQDLAIGNYSLVSKERVGRTAFDFTYQAKVTNSGRDVQNVTATLTSNSAHTAVVDDSLSFGDVASESTVNSSDTFTIRQDRRYPFNWSDLVWDIQCDIPEGHTQWVGPEGGRIEFPNGVILNIPDGALTEETGITIKDIQAEEVNTILSYQKSGVYDKRFIGGFSAEPDGLQFNAPIKAILPILPLKPGEIPIQMEIDFNEKKYWITKTNLTYQADMMVAEIEISHFSDPIVGAVSGISPKKLDELCTDPYWNARLSICDDFDDLQPRECLLSPAARPEGLICCREKSMDVKAKATDFSINRSTGECEILFDNVEVTFTDCMKDGAPVAPETHIMGEISSFCPDDMVLTINVRPSILNIFACDRELLTATITGRSSDGDIFFENIPFSPVWKPENSLIADVSPDGWVTGLSEGTVLVKALASAGSAIPPGEALINVRSNIRSFSVTPSSVSLKIDEAEMLFAEIEDAFGNLLDANDVSWSSLNYSVADLQLYNGSFTSVVGEGKGSTTVLAKYEYDCEKLQAEANVTVECPPIKFTIDPEMVTLIGSEVRMLEAVILDEVKNPLDNSSVTWESANPDIVAVSIPEGGYTSVTGVKESPVSIRITATYDDGCQTKEAYAFVKVDCPELIMSLPVVSIGVGSSIQLSVESDIPNVDLSKVAWSSSDNLKAFVLPTTGLKVAVYGESPGKAIITVTYDDGTCIKTAESAIDVVEGIAGNWNIWPTDQYEECRYCPAGMCDDWDWFELAEPDLSSFDVKISQRGGPENYYIEATMLGTGGVLIGTWDSKSRYFTLSTNTSDIDQCGYLFYGSDICGDAQDCRLESCKNETYINGYTLESGGKINSLEADSTWYYSVTFSYSTEPESPRGETEWECRGEATQKGERK